MITSYEAYRQLQWINVYSDRDIIGGSLDFYDTHFDLTAEERHALERGEMTALRARFLAEGFGLPEHPHLKSQEKEGRKYWEIYDGTRLAFTIRDAAGTLRVTPERQITNIPDPEARIPLVAHTEMWTTGTVFRKFYDAFH